MASGSYWQVYVQCPFYKQDDGKGRLDCEGVGNACSLSQSFLSKDDFQKWLQELCCQGYHKCRLYRIIMEKYEE